MNNIQTGNCAHCTRSGVDVMQLTHRGRPICLQCIQLQDEAHDDYDDRDSFGDDDTDLSFGDETESYSTLE